MTDSDTYRDYLGNPIEVGSYVVYSTSWGKQGNKLARGVVTALLPNSRISVDKHDDETPKWNGGGRAVINHLWKVLVVPTIEKYNTPEVSTI